MPRPIKCRRVSFFPQIKYFKPVGIPLKNLEEECLTMEELEAIRLKDLENLEQEQGALRMNVSRPTFQRVLTSARRKIAAALLQGKAIRIEGGRFELPPCHFKCRNGHEWDVPLELTINALPAECPECKSTQISCFHFAGEDCDNKGLMKCCRVDRLAIDIPLTDTVKTEFNGQARIPE